MSQFVLTLTLTNKHTGEDYRYCLNLPDEVAQDAWEIPPPDHSIPFLCDSMTTAVKRIKRRVFRKELFTREATRLGVLLAEYMEDKEGWHGEQRKETIRKQRKEQ